MTEPAGRVVAPPAGAGTRWERVARAADVPAGTLRAARLADGRQLCLANHDGEILAVLDRCTHQAFPLSEGELHPDGTIECAWHGARFDAHTGCACRGPAEEPVETFEVKVEDGDVYVRTSS